MPRLKLTTKIKRWASSTWSAWRSVVDWTKSNALYIVALSMLANAFGILAPERATALRDQFAAFVGFPT
jgi:hypothetical protein